MVPLPAIIRRWFSHILALSLIRMVRHIWLCKSGGLNLIRGTPFFHSLTFSLTHFFSHSLSHSFSFSPSIRLFFCPFYEMQDYHRIWWMNETKYEYSETVWWLIYMFAFKAFMYQFMRTKHTLVPFNGINNEARWPFIQHQLQHSITIFPVMHRLGLCARTVYIHYGRGGLFLELCVFFFGWFFRLCVDLSGLNTEKAAVDLIVYDKKGLMLDETEK